MNDPASKSLGDKGLSLDQAGQLDPLKKSFLRSFEKRMDDGLYFESHHPPLVNYEAANEIISYRYIDLFEAALLIGWEVDRDFLLLIPSCVDIFAEAVASGELDPREPDSHIKLSQLPETPIFYREAVNLNWRLTLQEVFEWASTRWPSTDFSILRKRIGEQEGLSETADNLVTHTYIA